MPKPTGEKKIYYISLTFYFKHKRTYNNLAREIFAVLLLLSSLLFPLSYVFYINNFLKKINKRKIFIFVE